MEKPLHRGLLLLLLTGIGLALAGQNNLEPPSNVRISKNHEGFSVTWDWNNLSDEDPGNVRFSVFVKKLSTRRSVEWRTVPGCLHVTQRLCKIYVKNLNPYMSYSLRVRSEISQKHSQWSSIVPFSPGDIVDLDHHTNVSVAFVDGRVQVTVSDTTTSEAMEDEGDLIYKLMFWENNSEEKTLASSDPVFILNDLLPDVEYCLKAWVYDTETQKPGPFSKTKCFTFNEKGLPENLRVLAVDTNYVLMWDWNFEQDPNVTFSVKMAKPLVDRKWSTFDGCENISTAECDVSSIVILGTYEFRVLVRDSRGNQSFSSAIKFQPLKDTVIGPPSDLRLKLLNNMLNIEVGNPAGFEKEALRYDCAWSYHLVMWQNSSDFHQEEHFKEPIFTVNHLKPSTEYCLKVQLVCKPDNRSGLFSETRCISTEPDYWFFWHIWGTLVIIVGLALISGLVYICLCPLQRYIKHIFCPTGKLPASIENGIPNSPFSTTNNQLLLEEEEITDPCYIIPSSEDRTEQYKISDRDGRDSGNYSNEDETTANGLL
ncbi:interferon alpha/beta receptor 1 [Spea bombifrons]|uniref:interferon alpha/beta receptor 1 n=1 Tax=Spea bombifrons TaxID=233779 RepID=UPI00234BF0A5|nr:interferon alpha/beta receptor 1 [Spea bombifrons]